MCILLPSAIITGKTSAVLYLLVLLAIEVAIVWIVLANVPVTGK